MTNNTTQASEAVVIVVVVVVVLGHKGSLQAERYESFYSLAWVLVD